MLSSVARGAGRCLRATWATEYERALVRLKRVIEVISRDECLCVGSPAATPDLEAVLPVTDIIDAMMHGRRTSWLLARRLQVG